MSAPRIYVLADKLGRVYLETEQNTRSFGNFWVLNGAIIFNGLRRAFLLHFFVSRLLRRLRQALR